MKAHATLKMTHPPSSMEMILRTPSRCLPAKMERGPVAFASARSIPVASLDDAVHFRQEILRRDEAPFRTAWRHGGLNE